MGRRGDGASAAAGGTSASAFRLALALAAQRAGAFVGRTRRGRAGALRVAGIDAVDGTPVYDVKPYLPWAEARPGARLDWAKDAPSMRGASDVVIPAEIAAQLSEPVVTLVRQLLTMNLQPAYQPPGSRARVDDRRRLERALENPRPRGKSRSRRVGWNVGADGSCAA